MAKNTPLLTAGFTLVELLVVVSVIGILALIALPTYEKYGVRAKVAESISALTMAKTAITEYYAINNSLPENASAAGIDETGYGEYIDELSVEDGVLYVTIAGTNIQSLDDSQVIFTPTEDADSKTLSWDCSPDSNTNNEYFPQSCRNSGD